MDNKALVVREQSAVATHVYVGYISVVLEQSAVATHVYVGHISVVVRAECCSYTRICRSYQ